MVEPSHVKEGTERERERERERKRKDLLVSVYIMIVSLSLFPTYFLEGRYIAHYVQNNDHLQMILACDSE